MPSETETPKRQYRAPLREDSALRTRSLITEAARGVFESQGWSGAKMSAIAERAGVSQSSVEAIFKTKPALLEAVVDYTIRGDVDPTPVSDRPITNQIEAAPDAVSMLELHAGHVRGVQSRTARLAFVVEQASQGDKRVSALWQKMNANRRYGVEWATRTLLSKKGADGLNPGDVETTFWVALEWANYRLLTDHVGMSDPQYERWLLTYYLRMLRLDE